MKRRRKKLDRGGERGERRKGMESNEREKGGEMGSKRVLAKLRRKKRKKSEHERGLRMRGILE